jgi:hypothetical protein
LLISYLVLEWVLSPRDRSTIINTLNATITTIYCLHSSARPHHYWDVNHTYIDFATFKILISEFSHFHVVNHSHIFTHTWIVLTLKKPSSLSYQFNLQITDQSTSIIILVKIISFDPTNLIKLDQVNLILPS